MKSKSDNGDSSGRGGNSQPASQEDPLGTTSSSDIVDKEERLLEESEDPRAFLHLPAKRGFPGATLVHKVSFVFVVEIYFVTKPRLVCKQNFNETCFSIYFSKEHSVGAQQHLVASQRGPQVLEDERTSTSTSIFTKHFTCVHQTLCFSSNNNFSRNFVWSPPSNFVCTILKKI